MYLLKNRIEKPPYGAILIPDHPLARGLVGAWLMNEGTGNQIFDALHCKSSGFNGAPAWISGNLYFDGSDDYINVGDVGPLELSPEFTITLLLDLTSFVLKPSPFFSKRGYKIEIYSISYGERNVLVNYDTTGTDGYAGSMDINPVMQAGPFWVSSVFPSASAPRIYISGQQIGYRAQTSPTGSPISSAGYGVLLGKDEYSSYFNGGIGFCAIHNCGLSDSEITQLHAEPYAMFEAPSRRKYFYVTSGGTTTYFIPQFMNHKFIPSFMGGK